MEKIKYDWYEDTNCARCTIYYNNEEFIGQAFCHPDDEDMCSKLAGQTIAEFRACIQVLKYKRDCEIIPALKALKQLHYSINKSKQYNKKSYESRMLYRQIQNYEADLKNIREDLAKIRQALNSYINLKEQYYQFLRNRRQAKAN